MYIVWQVSLQELRFEWSIAKARENRRKHGLSFEEAQTVFADDAVIRLISARRATPTERAQYDARWIR